MMSGGNRSGTGVGACPVYSATQWSANVTEKQKALFREWEGLCIGYLVSCKEGTNIRHLASQLEDQTGDAVPLSKMGLRSINDFLYLMQDYVDIRNIDVRYFVFIKDHMVPPQMQHIRDFVLKQHKSKGTKNRIGNIVRPTRGQSSHCSPDDLLKLAQRYQGSNSFSSGPRTTQPALVQEVRRVSRSPSGSRSRTNVQSSSYQRPNGYTTSYPKQPSRPANPAPLVKRSPLLPMTYNTAPSTSASAVSPKLFKSFFNNSVSLPNVTAPKPESKIDFDKLQCNLGQSRIEKTFSNESVSVTNVTPPKPESKIDLDKLQCKLDQNRIEKTFSNDSVSVTNVTPPKPESKINVDKLQQYNLGQNRIEKADSNDSVSLTNATPRKPEIDFDKLQCNLDTLDIFSVIKPRLSGPKPDRPSPAPSRDITVEDRLKVKAFPWPPFIVGERDKDVKSFLMKNNLMNLFKQNFPLLANEMID